MQVGEYFRVPAPAGFEFTGEIRPRRVGEWWLSIYGDVRGPSMREGSQPRRILRKLPEPPKGFVISALPAIEGASALDVLIGGERIGSINVRGYEEGKYGYCEAGPFHSSVGYDPQTRKFNTVLQAVIALLSSYENRRVPAS